MLPPLLLRFHGFTKTSTRCPSRAAFGTTPTTRCCSGRWGCRSATSLSTRDRPQWCPRPCIALVHRQRESAPTSRLRWSQTNRACLPGTVNGDCGDCGVIVVAVVVVADVCCQCWNLCLSACVRACCGAAVVRSGAEVDSPCFTGFHCLCLPCNSPSCVVDNADIVGSFDSARNVRLDPSKMTSFFSFTVAAGQGDWGPGGVRGAYTRLHLSTAEASRCFHADCCCSDTACCRGRCLCC